MHVVCHHHPSRTRTHTTAAATAAAVTTATAAAVTAAAAAAVTAATAAAARTPHARTHTQRYCIHTERFAWLVTLFGMGLRAFKKCAMHCERSSGAVLHEKHSGP